ncbi:MAG: HEPN domain-containing protein [Oligoflexia bacterium]|nr:HEPN domain-containing protein [Oligoflexia bacterium]
MNESSNNLLDQWRILSQKDLKAAKLLFKNNEFLLSAFHLQQAIEKFLKMYYI